MEYGPDLIASSHSAAAAVALRRKRQHHRHQVNSLAYVNIGQGNGGIIRDLAESGVAVQAVTPLHVNQQVQLRFELVSPRVRVETTGRVAWADSSGQAGLEFTGLQQRPRRLLAVRPCDVLLCLRRRLRLGPGEPAREVCAVGLDQRVQLPGVGGFDGT